VLYQKHFQAASALDHDESQEVLGHRIQNFRFQQSSSTQIKFTVSVRQNLFAVSKLFCLLVDSPRGLL
jgi:hypothetical protein